MADASGTWGCAVVSWHMGAWFQVPWPAPWASSSIAIKELLPLWSVQLSGVVPGRHFRPPCSLTMRQWCGHCLMAQLGIQALAYLLRYLFFFETHFKFTHSISHIAGAMNIPSDALSRNQMPHFFATFPQAQPFPSTIPPILLDVLMDPARPWTSTTWRQQLRTFS